RSCSDEGDRSRPPEGGHPRSAGPSGDELAAPARVRGPRRPRRARDRRGPRRRGPGARTHGARAHVRAAAREPADRVVRDRPARERRVTSLRPRIGVIQFPGSNDDRDALWALAALEADAIPVWHEETELPDLDAVVLPGGFSYGDYLRCGAIARFSPAMAAVARFAELGGLALGICNG